MAGAGSTTSAAAPCASCKLLRRRCTQECVFAPYFPAGEPQRFAIVHRVFGASNVSKMLQELPAPQRADAVSSLVYEATARVRDPVYGAAGAISYLQHQVSQLQMQLALAHAQAEILCSHRLHDIPPPPPPSVAVAAAAAASTQQQLHIQLQLQQEEEVQMDGLALMNTLNSAAAAHQLMLQEACLKKEPPLWA